MNHSSPNRESAASSSSSFGIEQFESPEAKWVSAETPFSLATADRLIKVADEADQTPQFAVSVGQFDKTARYLLVAAPDDVKEELLGCARAGEQITTAVAKEVVERSKPAPVTSHDEALFVELTINKDSWLLVFLYSRRAGNTQQ